MRTLALLFMFAAGAPLVALAEEQAASAPAAAEPKLVKVRAVSLRPTDPGYPPELANGGVQGTTELLIRINTEGVPTDVSVRASSRSQALDQAAIAVGKDLKFTVKDPSKPPGDLIVPIEFMRDSVASLSRKSCAEFNVDVAYFKSTFPELDTRKMTVINMTVGAFVALGISGPPDKSLALIKKVEAAAKGVIDACAKDPEASFTKTFGTLVKEGGG
nr:hypothetical protein [uncultured bacterium]